MCFTGIISHVGFKIARSTRELEQPNHNASAGAPGPSGNPKNNAMDCDGPGGGCESDKPLLDVASCVEGDSDIEIDDSWHR